MQVLLLDADCVPVRNPEWLFASQPDFLRSGALFWPDLWSDWEKGAVFNK